MVWKWPNTAMKVRTIGIRQRFGQNKFEWIRLLTRWRTIWTTKESTAYGLVSLSEHVENYSSTISNKINEYKLSSSVFLVLFCKLRWCVQFPYCQDEKPILKVSCFVGIFTIEAHLADVVLHDMWVLFLSSEF